VNKCVNPAVSGKANNMNISRESPKQIQYLNITRIAATFLVILHHSISPYIQSAEYFNKRIWWICSFANSITCAAVPLFLMISGYLLLNNPKTLDFAKFYKKHIPRVFIPFMAWDIIYFITKIFARKETLQPGLIKKYFDELIASGSYYHLWFVYTIIAIYLFAPFLKKIIDGCSLKQLIWLMILITFGTTIRPFINNVAPVYVYLFDPIANGYFGYFVLGYILGKYDMGKKVKILIFFGGIAGMLISSVGNYWVSSSGQYKLVFNNGFSINHFLCASAIFVLFKSIKRLENIKNLKTANLISYISSITFGVYLSHALVLEFFSRITDFPPAVSIAVHFSATAAVCFAMSAVLSNIKYINKILI